VGNSVGSQTGELVGQVRQREEVLLDGEVEGVTVLEVCRDCETSACAQDGRGDGYRTLEDSADLLEGEEAAERSSLRVGA
jgi:hypothetical protein